MLHLGSLIDIARGLVFPFPAQTVMIVHADQGLLGLTQIFALCLCQGTGIMASCHTLVPMCLFCLRPFLTLMRDHFNMRVDCPSKLIPL